MITNEEDAKRYVAELCDQVAMDRLEVLCAKLAAENEFQNLISKATIPMVWRRHVADSAQLLSYSGPEAKPWLDLGSGAGFPGLVIAAMRPERRVVLVESRRRRIDWLDQIALELGLKNCHIEGARLETVGSFEAGTISARAFAPFERLLGLSARFSTNSTAWVLPKGRSAAQEVQTLGRRANGMFHVEQSITDGDAGIIVGEGKWSEMT